MLPILLRGKQKEFSIFRIISKILLKLFTLCVLDLNILCSFMICLFISVLFPFNYVSYVRFFVWMLLESNLYDIKM